MIINGFISALAGYGRFGIPLSAKVDLEFISPGK